MLELCDGADLLIHDAQYTADEWEHKAHWGHCTVDYAVHVARRPARARSRSSTTTPPTTTTRSTACSKGRDAPPLGMGVDEVIAAAEGLTVSYER